MRIKKIKTSFASEWMQAQRPNGASFYWTSIAQSNFAKSKFTTIERPTKLTRRGHEIKLIDTSGASPQNADPVLLRLVVQGFAARKHLLEGKPQSLVEGLSKRHLSRLARLSLLAPDIIQAILDGRQPSHLTSRELMRRGDIPLVWNEQRKLLGFS